MKLFSSEMFLLPISFLSFRANLSLNSSAISAPKFTVTARNYLPQKELKVLIRQPLFNKDRLANFSKFQYQYLVPEFST